MVGSVQMKPRHAKELNRLAGGNDKRKAKPKQLKLMTQLYKETKRRGQSAQASLDAVRKASEDELPDDRAGQDGQRGGSDALEP
jgi:hypothetical protein